MKQDYNSIMSSAMRRLGHEISKLGLRMRNRSPSGSESDVCGSTDEMTTVEYCSAEQQGHALLHDDSCENCSASAYFDATSYQTKQRRHSRNELDEDVVCSERKSSIKAALKPVLSRKSRSDLARYPRLNPNFNLTHETLKRNGSKNSIKENDIEGIVTANNGRSKTMDEIPSVGYHETVAHADTKTKEGRRKRGMKRSKSFSGLLGWRKRKDSSENDAKWTTEFPRKVLRRTSSLSKVHSKSVAAEKSINATLPTEATMISDINEMQRNTPSKFSAEIFFTSQSSNNDSRISSGVDLKKSEIRFSYMALKGFRYDEGMIETDLCSTEL